MSSSITVKILKDGQKIEDGIILLEMYTTPTRELSAEVELEYNGSMTFEEYENTKDDPLQGYKHLTEDKLDEILNYYTTEIASLKKSLDVRNKEIERLENLMIKVASLEIYDRMKNDIQDHGSFILYLEEAIDTAEFFYNKWNYGVKNVLVENEKFKIILLLFRIERGRHAHFYIWRFTLEYIFKHCSFKRQTLFNTIRESH